MTDNSGPEKKVCKVFFLTTLGYHQKNDRFISTIMASGNYSSDSNRACPRQKRKTHPRKYSG
jgi:hypothetical protein